MVFSQGSQTPYHSGSPARSPGGPDSGPGVWTRPQREQIQSGLDSSWDPRLQLFQICKLIIKISDCCASEAWTYRWVVLFCFGVGTFGEIKGEIRDLRPSLGARGDTLLSFWCWCMTEGGRICLSSSVFVCLFLTVLLYCLFPLFSVVCWIGVFKCRCRDGN